MQITLLDKAIKLLPESAAVLPLSRTLVIADVHLGKSATFRSKGIPIPEGDTQNDLSTISTLILKHDIKQLVIAGDLVHSQLGLTDDILCILQKWIQSTEIPITLTEGNHDKQTSLHELDINITSDLMIDGIQITHYPEDLSSQQAGIAGHLHPSIQLKESARKKMTFKGFHIKQSQHLILPSFSPFTGNHPISSKQGDTFIATIDHQLFIIPL